MIHEIRLVESLAKRPTRSLTGEVFRATRMGLDPLAPSTRGGRWAQPGGAAVLNSSLDRDGALAEISFHWGRLTPLPSKPAALHRLRAKVAKALHLIEADFQILGVDPAEYRSPNYRRTQEIGAAVAFLGHDGLIVPSARWPCENLVIMMDNHDLNNELSVVSTEEIDWRTWAKEHHLLDETN